MALKEYEYNGGTYQFDEDSVPKGAKPVEVKAVKPRNKQAPAPVNKSE